MNLETYRPRRTKQSLLTNDTFRSDNRSTSDTRPKLSQLLEIGGGILILPFVSHEGRMLCRVSVKLHSLFCNFQWNVECFDFSRCCTISTAFLPSDDEDDDDYTPDCEMNEFEINKGMCFAYFKCCVFIFALCIFVMPLFSSDIIRYSTI